MSGSYSMCLALWDTEMNHTSRASRPSHTAAVSCSRACCSLVLMLGTDCLLMFGSLSVASCVEVT